MWVARKGREWGHMTDCKQMNGTQHSKAVISVNTRYRYLANGQIPLGRSQGGFLEEVTLKN